jgi:hypothetical protein
MGRYTHVVFSNPAEGRETDYNRWYDETHLPEVLAVPGVVRASRHRIPQTGDTAPEHRYLALYEIEADDPQQVLNEIMRRVETGEIALSDTVAGNGKMLLVEEITRRER